MELSLRALPGQEGRGSRTAPDTAASAGSPTAGGPTAAMPAATSGPGSTASSPPHPTCPTKRERCVKQALPAGLRDGENPGENRPDRPQGTSRDADGETGRKESPGKSALFCGPAAGCRRLRRNPRFSAWVSMAHGPGHERVTDKLTASGAALPSGSGLKHRRSFVSCFCVAIYGVGPIAM